MSKVSGWFTVLLHLNTFMKAVLYILLAFVLLVCVWTKAYMNVTFQVHFSIAVCSIGNTPLSSSLSGMRHRIKWCSSESEFFLIKGIYIRRSWQCSEPKCRGLTVLIRAQFTHWEHYMILYADKLPFWKLSIHASIMWFAVWCDFCQYL